MKGNKQLAISNEQLATSLEPLQGPIAAQEPPLSRAGGSFRIC